MLVLVIHSFPFPLIRARGMPLAADSRYLADNTVKKDFYFHIFALPDTNVIS
jgi:hypothetical protein